MSSLKQAQDKKTQIFTAILHWEEDVYVAECPEVGTEASARNDRRSDRLFARSN